MILYCNQLYRSLQKDLLHFKTDPFLTLKDAEVFFAIGFRYWIMIYNRFRFHAFRSRSEEIRFFKKIKPLFTSEIEYAQLVCQGLLFQPPEQKCAYWQREGERLARFYKDQDAFCTYYQSGDTGNDGQCFTRIAADSRLMPATVYVDEGLASLYDPLLCRLMALNRYNSYVQRQIENLDAAAGKKN